MSLILYSFFASVNSLPAGIVARGSFFSFCESAVGACIRPICAGLGVRLQSQTQHFCQFPFCMTEYTAFTTLRFFKRFFQNTLVRRLNKSEICLSLPRKVGKRSNSCPSLPDNSQVLLSSLIVFIVYRSCKV